VGLGERVSCKRLNLAPHLPRDLLGIALVTAVAEKAFSDLLHLPARPVLAAHGTPERVGIREIEAGEVMTHLQHILLVDHHPECLAEKILHHRVDILEVVRVMEAIDELPHHP